ncbi:MAG: hypothetical protein ISR47_00670 [Rhodospirillales bacterium]|nr:hypothetical protein [Rhodospirillales bacterium]
MDRIDLIRRLDLENDVLAVIDKCTLGAAGVCCFDQIKEFIGSLDGPEGKADFLFKAKVIMELEEIADACPKAPDQFCPARLVISNVLQ